MCYHLTVCSHLFFRVSCCGVSTCPDLQTIGIDTSALQVCTLRPLSAALRRMAATGADSLNAML